MWRVLPVLILVLTVVLIAAATVHHSGYVPASTPEGAVQSLYNGIKTHDYDGAYSYVAKSSNTAPDAFYRDVAGQGGSLQTYSNLSTFDTRVLNESGDQAIVRVNSEWATAVGAIHNSRDLKVVREGNTWRVLWPVAPQAHVPPQVIPVTYLRWDVINRGSGDDWGAQNVEAPRVRIISMNATERDGATVVMGEIENEDTVPGFVSVGATLLGNDGKTLGQETSFDKISHTLLPKEVSPFRIDFPGVKLSSVKNVRMTPNSMLVPAAADPVIGVLHQQVVKDNSGHPVLSGELINESGLPVNIPHVLATFYDNSGKVIWVSDGYVDKALTPQTPVPFTLAMREDLLPQVHSYRVTVNQYSMDRPQ
jgi:hypothetical protein